jgi:hypothetical protein
LKSKIFKTRCSISEYKKLIDDYSKLEKPEKLLIVEVVSGSKFKNEVTGHTPFVEIAQDMKFVPSWKVKKMTKCVDGVIEENYLASSFARYVNSNTKVESDKTPDEEYKNKGNHLDFELGKNKFIYSTNIDSKPNDRNIYEWSKMTKFYFDSEIPEKMMYFSVNLYKTKKKREKAKQFGIPKTFYCLHFNNQKVNEIVLDFRESFQSASEGHVNMRIQYIFDHVPLFKKILKSLEKREKLLLRILDELEKIDFSSFSKVAIGINDTLPS